MTTDTVCDERFWSKVDDSGDGCWEWTAHRNKDGYGAYRTKDRNGERAVVGAHRYSYAEVNGPIPDGLHVLHSCNNPPCVRPSHLRLGTPKDNAADRTAAGDPGRPRGEAHGGAKLTWEDVRAIRAGCAAGVPQAHFAKKFGMTSGAIHYIVRGKHWRYDPLSIHDGEAKS